jgi:hypothetical protein
MTGFNQAKTNKPPVRLYAVFLMERAGVHRSAFVYLNQQCFFSNLLV